MAQSPDQFQPTYDSCSEVTEQCPIEATIYGSYFNLPANVIFAIIFGLALIGHVWCAARTKVWSFSAWIIAGGIMQVIGYIARSAMHSQPWSIELLSLQICGLLWGPSLLAAGISIVFKDMVGCYGGQHSILRPKLIPWVFIGTDLISINIQGVGGIIAAVFTANPGSTMAKVGENMMIAGVSSQVANMLLCGSIMLVYWRRYQKYSSLHGDDGFQAGFEKHSSSTGAKKFKVFAWMVSTAYVCILIRTIYRVAEMAGGWANPIMRHELSFLLLDALPVSVAFILLLVFHPGTWFPQMRERETKYQPELPIVPTGAQSNWGAPGGFREDEYHQPREQRHLLGVPLGQDRV